MRRTLAWVVSLVGMLAACADDGGATASFTLRAAGAEACAARCVASLRVEVVGDPAHAAVGSCEAPLELSGLPPDVPLSVRVTALDAAGYPRLTGTSTPTLAGAGETIEVDVPLQSTMVVTALEPPPPWFDAPSKRRVTIRGQGFGAGPPSDAAVTLGAASLAVAAVDWTPEAITAELGPTDAGGALVVTACGVSTAPYGVPADRVRVVPATIAVSDCAGASLAAAAAEGPGARLEAAFACASGRAVIGPLDLEAGVLEGGPALQIVPAGVAIGNQQNRVIVAGQRAVWIFKSGFASDAIAKPPAGFAVTSLATYAGFHIAAVVTNDSGDESALWTLHGAGWEPLELRLEGVEFIAVDGPFVLAREDGEGRLFRLTTPEGDAASGALVPASLVSGSWRLPGCADPVALAVARSWTAATQIWKLQEVVAVVCAATDAQPAVVLRFDAAGEARVGPLAALDGLDSPTAVVLDRAAAVAWVWSPSEGAVLAVELATGATKGRWSGLGVAPPGSPIVRSAGEDRFVVPGAGAGAITQLIVEPQG